MLELVVAAALVVGLVGVVVPVLPGLLLMWAAVVVWAAADGGGPVRWATVGVVTVVVVAGWVAGTWWPARRTGQTGVPDWVVAVGALGMVVGLFLIPVVGVLVGGVLGVFAAELARTRDLRRAWRVTVETLKGYGLGVAVQALAGGAVVAVWLAGVWLS